MEFAEVLDGLDRLWFCSNVLLKSTPRIPKPDSPVMALDHRLSVHGKVLSWLDDSIEALKAAAQEEEAVKAERSKALQNVEQSTLIALVMSERSIPRQPPPRSPVSSPRSRDCLGKKGKSMRRLKSIKDEPFERKRSVLAEIEYDYVWESERCRNIPEPDEFYQRRIREQTAKAGVF